MFEPVIGLEVHVQLKTNSKIFCSCAVEFASPPNTQTCPVCLGFPGSLPVLNELAMESTIKTGLALNCEIQKFTKFDRKNYYYPDLPKNYQISQYDLPFALKGFLDIEVDGAPRRIGITRAHLEEDAGKLIHEDDCTLVDYNRAGTPLLEIVSEPEIISAQEAYAYLTELKAILQYLNVSDCDMEKGSLRCDANISLHPAGEKKLGTKSELKNLNSFKAVRDALIYEISRHKEILESGGKIIQETRLWDAGSLKTYSMRSKEEAMDYRYFPEPDLPAFVITEETINRIKSTLPELPKAVKVRFVRDYGLSAYDAEVLASEQALVFYFENCVKLLNKPKVLSNWLMGAVKQELNSRNMDAEKISQILKAQDLISLISFVEEGKISNLSGKDVLHEVFESGKSPQEIIKEKDLIQISGGGELDEFIDKVIADNAKSVQDYQAGKVNALMFLVGQVMRLSKGKANPKVLQELLAKKLSGG